MITPFFEHHPVTKMHVSKSKDWSLTKRSPVEIPLGPGIATVPPHTR